MKFTEFGEVKDAFSSGAIFACSVEELRSALSVLGPKTAGDMAEGKTQRMIGIINALSQMKANEQLHTKTQRVAMAAIIVAIASVIPALVSLFASFYKCQ